MTGFGKAERLAPNKKFSVEIRSLNSKQLDLSIKMPKKFNYFEAAMRTLLKDYIQRGKVDVFYYLRGIIREDPGFSLKNITAHWPPNI